MPLTDHSDSIVTRNLLVEDLLTLGDNTPLHVPELSAAAPTPPAGTVAVYAKSDGHLYARDDSGTERDLSGAVPSALRTVGKMLYIEWPATGDAFPLAFLPADVTFVRVRGVTDTGTVDFQIERRATNTPGSGGTNVLSSALQATSAGASTTSFADGGAVAAGQWLYFVASATSGSPTRLWVALEYTVDEAQDILSRS
ncbi:MAG: hypothetical protein J5J06_12255 [Phycisphaerae bacterium]|nr:hypothetical protein [Phycisphaerae bacterium]